jgi:hypothetical protein
MERPDEYERAVQHWALLEADERNRNAFPPDLWVFSLRQAAIVGGVSVRFQSLVMLETIAGGAEDPTGISPVLLSCIPIQLAVCRITLTRIWIVSRHARGDAQHIDGQGLTGNHHERLTLK